MLYTANISACHKHFLHAPQRQSQRLHALEICTFYISLPTRWLDALTVELPQAVLACPTAALPQAARAVRGPGLGHADLS